MNAWWRWALLIAIDVAMVVALVQVWRSESDRATSVPIATADPAEDVRATPPTSLSTPSTDPLQERLAKLRAGDDYLELAEVERARLADQHHVTLGRLGWLNDQGEIVGFLNPREIWDDIALPTRDDLLLAGPEYGGVLFGGRMTSTLGPVRALDEWQLLVVTGAYLGGDHRPRLRMHHYLIEMTRYATGRVVERMPPLDVDPSQYGSWQELADEMTRQAFAWMQQRM